MTEVSKTASMLVRTYALCSAPPSELYFSKHLPNYLGLDRKSVNSDLIWGVYGTNAMNSADAYASMDAQHTKRNLYQIDLYYKVLIGSGKNTVITEEMAQAGAHYNLDRLEVNFRGKLFKRLCGYLSNKDRAPYLATGSGKSLHDLLRDHPMLIHRFMAEEPSCNALTHTVLINGGISLRMATLRKVPANIDRVHVRYHDEIQAFA